MVKQKRFNFDENKEGRIPDIGEIKEKEPVKHRVYMRDWYFNAGIVGFLEIIADSKDLDEIDGLTVGENYIEFENKVLDDFEEKFEKKAFLYFFKKYKHIKFLNGIVLKVDEEKDKLIEQSLKILKGKRFIETKKELRALEDIQILRDELENLKISGVFLELEIRKINLAIDKLKSEKKVVENIEKKIIKEFGLPILEALSFKFKNFFTLKDYKKQIINLKNDLEQTNVSNIYSFLRTNGYYNKIKEVRDKFPQKEFLLKLPKEIINNNNIYDELELKKDAISKLNTKKLKKLSKWLDLNTNILELENSIKLIKKNNELSKSDIDKIQAAINILYKRNNICLSCQVRITGDKYLNKGLSQFIGANKDNLNWVWGLNDKNLKLCNQCALIYSCSILSLFNVYYNQINKYYFINYNSSLKVLYKEFTKFKKELELIDDNNKFSLILISLINSIEEKRAKSINQNINFIELKQSIGGYSIFSYSINSNIAGFLSSYGIDNIPSGYLSLNKNKSEKFYLKDELLRKAILNQIDYDLLNKYMSYDSRSCKHGIDCKSLIKTTYNLNYLTNFILKYINYTLGENNMMEKRNKIIKKAYCKGKELRTRVPENQRTGLVYRFLNDLKIADREKFLDKYIRIMMSHKLDINFGLDEMTDDNNFLQFGYSFINGFMCESCKPCKKKEEDDNNNGGK